MKRIVIFAVIAVVAFFAKEYFYPNSLPKDSVIQVASNNVAMNEARARAVETISQYWKHNDNRQPGQGNFSIKVKITDSNGAEHFWVNNVKRQGDEFVGIISNEPAKVKSVKFKQKYKFRSSDISDWMYMDNGKIYGGFSIRVLAEMMPEKEAKKFKSILAYEPK